jgi:acetaldehyde dehydrogenase
MREDGMELVPQSIAIVGSGNIATDLLMKLLRSQTCEVLAMVGIDPQSDGLKRAAELGVETSAEGVDWLLEQRRLPALIVEATSARAHRDNAPRYEAFGLKAIDLTPAALGPYCIPVVNLTDHLDAPNLNLSTCGGQATVPIVAAVSAVCDVSYAEIVSSVASRSAGPGTRANIDEFTRTTARTLESVGGARQGKAIIILNPAEPPVLMRNTVYCAIGSEADEEQIIDSIQNMVTRVSEYVPGYRLVREPQFDSPRPEWGGLRRVAVLLEVEGNGDYLPPYAGNLDIMTSAAVRVAEQLTTDVALEVVSDR